MKVYVASSWRNTIQPAVVHRLREAGHEVYDFRYPAPGNHGFSWKQVHSHEPPWSAVETRETLLHAVAEGGFKLDFDAMKWSDAIVMVQPCGRSAALELGWGAGAGKRTIVLLADGQEPELMVKMADRLCVSLDEVLDALEVSGENGPTPDQRLRDAEDAARRHALGVLRLEARLLRDLFFDSATVPSHDLADELWACPAVAAALSDTGHTSVEDTARWIDAGMPESA